MFFTPIFTQIHTCCYFVLLMPAGASTAALAFCRKEVRGSCGRFKTGCRHSQKAFRLQILSLLQGRWLQNIKYSLQGDKIYSYSGAFIYDLLKKDFRIEGETVLVKASEILVASFHPLLTTFIHPLQPPPACIYFRPPAFTCIHFHPLRSTCAHHTF